MTRALALSLLLLAACDGGAVDDTADDTAEAACATLPTAGYRANGSCFGMAMNVDLTFDGATCAFTLDNWSMNHGDAPEGGTLDGTDVAITGPGWDGCVGEADGTTIAGTCPDGCAWEFAER